MKDLILINRFLKIQKSSEGTWGVVQVSYPTVIEEKTYQVATTTVQKYYKCETEARVALKNLGESRKITYLNNDTSVILVTPAYGIFYVVMVSLEGCVKQLSSHEEGGVALEKAKKEATSKGLPFIVPNMEIETEKKSSK